MIGIRRVYNSIISLTTEEKEQAFSQIMEHIKHNGGTIHRPFLLEQKNWYFFLDEDEVTIKLILGKTILGREKSIFDGKFSDYEYESIFNSLADSKKVFLST